MSVKPERARRACGNKLKSRFFLHRRAQRSGFQTQSHFKGNVIKIMLD